MNRIITSKCLTSTQFRLQERPSHARKYLKVLDLLICNSLYAAHDVRLGLRPYRIQGYIITSGYGRLDIVHFKHLIHLCPCLKPFLHVGIIFYWVSSRNKWAFTCDETFIAVWQAWSACCTSLHFTPLFSPLPHPLPPRPPPHFPLGAGSKLNFL